VELRSLADTRALAGLLVSRLPPGSLLVLSGELGAGKTTLTQLLGEALESEAAVSSPSYTLVHEYPTPEGPLVHIDAYRLPSAETLLDMGFDDYLARARLVVVEWGEALLAHYPEAALVRLELTPQGRRAVIEGF
jgi:tRNA threonylcarbamoyladenosine biosynthesis protein TsaE